ncbi:MAG: diguanylate cyclase [Phycisphaerales bacterium]|nr:diguanylate cyclase [Phycisphaerales bacterium]
MNATTLHPFEDSQPTVLLIDDSVDVHRLLKARLRYEDLKLAGASNGKEGLEQARTASPAIVLLDLDMPDMDGFEVLRRLKDDPATLDIPVIVLSGLQSAQDKVTAFDLGAVDYITKPFNLTELRVRVRSALRLHRLVQMLAQRAQIDGLTGLWNRAHFNKRWTDEVSACTRHHRPLSLALIDLDHFKTINDTYGHPAGDAVLQGLSRVLQRECRQEDVGCRYGGEEFTLIMPDTTPTDAAGVCERILAALASISWPRHPERAVTASIGLAGPDVTADLSADQWLDEADRALYAAKQSGRNRVVTRLIGQVTPMAKAG